MSERALRVGDTVRRPRSSNSPLVQALLEHFERIGFEGAPRFLGVDGEGRDIVSWIDGEAGALPAPADDSVLDAIGRLMREMHDAQTSFVPPREIDWPAAAEVVCHNDWWPGNLVFRGGLPVVLIDWGLAAPGPGMQDLARAAAWWAPLRPDDAVRARGLDPARRGERLRVLCDSYGLDAPARAAIVATAIAAQLDWSRQPPDPAAGEAMRDNAAWIATHRDELEPWLR